MAKTVINGTEYIDIEDITCPKCGCEDFEWDNIDSYPNSNTWECECTECGHKFIVVEESFYRYEE